MRLTICALVTGVHTYALPIFVTICLTPLVASFFEITSGTCMSTRRFGSFGLVIVGALGGVLISLGITAAAQRGDPLPLKELQQFANVFAAITSSYLVPVTDKQLIVDAIKI